MYPPKTFLNGIHLAESRVRKAKPRITWGEVVGAALLGLLIAWGVMQGL